MEHKFSNQLVCEICGVYIFSISVVLPCIDNNKTSQMGYDPNDLQALVDKQLEQYNKERLGDMVAGAKNICTKGGFHEFIPYKGLNEAFEYCKKCDVKKHG